MADKSPILRATSFNDYASLFRFLRSPGMRALVSSGQAETLVDIIDARLPADITLEQRTPKGTIYAYIEGEYFASVSQSGAVKYPKPRYIWNKLVRVYPDADNA